MKRAFIWIFVFVFLPLGGFTVDASRTDLLPQQNVEEASLESIPNEINPPEECGIPLNGPFGKDLEVFRGGDDSLRYDYTPVWKTPDYIISPCSGATLRPTIAAVAIGSEQIVTVWEEFGSPLKYDTWNGSWSGAPSSLPDYPETIFHGNPVLVSPNGVSWEVYVLDYLGADGQIQHLTWENETLTDWEPLPGLTGDASATSDPAVLITGSQHKLVFYRDKNGDIRFTEYQSGVWRNTPVALPDIEKTILLPLIVKQSTTSSSLLEPKSENNLTSPALPTVYPSELSAYSRNTHHAAVFFVDENNRLWVNEWTHLNNSEWSDTHWVLLMENVISERPAVTSRHINHLAVAVRDTAGMAYIIEWTPDLNSTGQAGWQAPYPLGKFLDGPLALASTSVDSLSVFGTDATSEIWQLNWTADSAWGEWTHIGPAIGSEPASRILTTVVRRMNDIMLFYRIADHCAGYKHYTSQDVTPSETSIIPAEDAQGYPLGQTTTWVDGKTLWVTAHAEDGLLPQYWQVDAFQLGEANPPPPGELVLEDGNHQYTADTLVAMKAADLDFDGNDEVVVATSYTPDGANTSILLSVLDLEIDPTLTISELATEEIETVLDAPLTFSLALNDLNGDGIKNELVLAFKTLYAWDPIQLLIYQYDAQSTTLVWKDDATLDLDLNYGMTNYFGAQVQVGTGIFYSGYFQQQIVVSDLGLYYWSEDTRFYVFPTMRTYYVDTSLPEAWAIQPIDDSLITHDDWWLEVAKPDAYFGSGVTLEQMLGSYSSAVDTGDLDADGYDEIALAYSNHILTVDPGDAGDTVEAIQFDDTWFVNAGPDSSIAVGDVDLDGRAEILSEMTMEFFPDYPPKLNLFELMGNGTLQRSNTFNLPTLNQGGSLHAILIDDIDNDSFVSRLTGCGTFGEVKIVAVLNGAPRWYAGDMPINQSGGTYSVTGEEETGFEYGTRFNLGSSLSVGFEQTFEIPVIAVEAGGVRASVSSEFMSSQGISQSSEIYESWSIGLGFENYGLGIVVYEVIPTTCNFYDVYNPDSPADTFRAMSCIPGAQDYLKTRLRSLEEWRSQTMRDAAGLSWVDVGHQAPNGAYTNDLGIVGNYRPVLPVDDFMLVYACNPVKIRYDVAGLSQEWTYVTGIGGALTQFSEMEMNTVTSAGVTVFGATLDTSVTTGVGFNHSHTMSWGNSLAFSGEIFQYQDPSRLCYSAHPYVYLAKAITLAGATYPYWEMDYYVTDIGIDCDLKSTANP